MAQGESGVVSETTDDGSVRWTTQLPSGTFDNHESFPASMAVTDDIVVATHQGSLVALDLSSGSVLWTHESDDDNSFGRTSPVVVNGRIYYAGGISVYRVDAAGA